jgi:hypothetical protein
MKKQENKAALLSRFANRQGSVEAFAKQQRVSVSSLYRWQAEQRSGGFVQIKPEVASLHEAGSFILQKGDLRIEFAVLPELGYLQSMVKLLLSC